MFHVKLVDRFRYWIAEPLLEKLRAEHVQDVTTRQTEAYQLGIVHGQLQGQQHLLSEFMRYQDERKATTQEVTEADIERAKKGMVH